MVTSLCAFCNKHSHFSHRWGNIVNEQIWAAETCNSCEALRIVRIRIPRDLIGSYSPGSDYHQIGRLRDLISGGDVWPRKGESPPVDDVPAHIARAAQEAYSSASVGNHMAAILMARTVIEATAKHQGHTTGTLAAKINSLRDAGDIRPAVAEQAHEVRFAGNDMAHGDIDVQPDDTDSEEILILMGEVLNEVFQSPARLERIRTKRTAT